MTLKDKYLLAIRQFKHTKPYFMALIKKKLELYNAYRRHRRAIQALLKYQSKKADE
ncbi:MAG: hypothetical protein ACL7BU_15085 [Candidatus Phlomobacter fragariae]